MLSGFIDGTALVPDAQDRVSELLNTAIRSKTHVRVRFAPTLDAALAAGIVLYFLEAGGLRTIVRPEHRLRELGRGEPTILVGLPVAGDAELGEAPYLYVGSKEVKRIPGSRKVVLKNASTTALMAQIFSHPLTSRRYPRSKYSAIIAAYSLGLDSGEQRSLTGLEKKVAEELAKDNLVYSLKPVFFLPRLPRETVKRALSLSLLPYVPGVSGRVEEAERVLEEKGIPPDATYDYFNTPENMAKLFELLVGLMKNRYTRRSGELKNLVAGESYYLKGTGENTLWDLREAALVLEVLLDTEGVAPILSYICMGEPADTHLYSLYLEKLPQVARIVEKASGEPGFLEELHTQKRVRVWGFKWASKPPLTVIRKILYSMGVVGSRDPLVVEEGGRLYVTYQQVHMLGHAFTDTFWSCAEPVDEGWVRVDRPECLIKG